MKLTFLGTSCMVPTKERNVSGMYLDFNGTGMLFDCGEGTQRQMNIAGINRNKVRYIFISHWHADHVAGILGLMQTISQQSDKLTIVGPVQTKERMQKLIEATYFDMKLNLEIIEVSPKVPTIIIDEKLFLIQAVEISHGIPCLGYALIEKDKLNIDTKKLQEHNIPSGPHLAKLQNGEDSSYKQTKLLVSEFTLTKLGKKFAYIADTKYTDTLYEIAQNANVLVTESTYCADMQTNATKYHHMTSTQAAKIAKQANVKSLYLTHISQRYTNTNQMLKEAKEIFPKSVVAVDFLVVKI
jgi:ribonuclease Z